MGAVRTWVVVVLVVAISGVTGLGLWADRRASEPPRFCTTGLAFAEVDGRGAVLEDQGQPGPDGCDRDAVPDPDDVDVMVSDTDDDPLVLGFDCAVRAPDGEVVATTAPNRSDGTCGKDG